MSQYNLSDNVDESFTFSVGGVSYKMRYPLTSEIEEMKKLADQAQQDQKEGKKLDEDVLSSYLYGFITPVDEDAEGIQSMLKKQNLKVLRNFNTMIKTEFGG